MSIREYFDEIRHLIADPGTNLVKFLSNVTGRNSSGRRLSMRITLFINVSSIIYSVHEYCIVFKIYFNYYPCLTSFYPVKTFPFSF